MESTTKLLTVTILVLAVFLPAPLEAANILFFTPFGSPSHVISYTPLIDELDARGHNVTYLALFKYNSLRKNSTVHDFHLTNLDDFIEDNRINFFHIKTFNWTLIRKTMYVMSEGTCVTLLEDPAFLKVVLDKSTKYDLVVIDNLMSDCGLSIINLLGNPPFIYYCTASLYSWTALALDVPEPFSYVPFHMVPYDTKMSFKERLLNTMAQLTFIASRHWYTSPVVNEVIRSHFLGVPPVLEIEQNVSFILTNSHASVTNNVKPSAPFVVEVGATHCRPAKPLPKDQEDFIAGAGDDGFIFFSMGSNIKATDLPQDKIDSFLNAFKRLKQRVFWKFEADLPNLPPNVRIQKWLSQQDLLGHPKIKLFITHGGLLSVQETLYHGVPVIGIPIYSDQKSNIAIAASSGYGQYLDYDEITEEVVYNMISNGISNSSFKERVKHYSSLMKDIPMDSLKLATYWVEYMIRHKGTRHLRLGTAHLNIFQYFLLDVIAVIVAVLILIIYIAKKVIFYVCKKVFCKSSKNSRPKGKAKNKKE